MNFIRDYLIPFYNGKFLFINETKGEIMKTRIWILFLAITTLCGCASVPMASPTQDIQAKQFQPDPDKAVVYLYRSESMGGSVKMDVSVDGKPEGSTAAETYFRFELEPGHHTITSTAENTDSVDIDAEAGHLYFVWQEVKMGILYARNKLHIVEAEEGEAGVRECKLAAQTSNPPSSSPNP